MESRALNDVLPNVSVTPQQFGYGNTLTCRLHHLQFNPDAAYQAHALPGAGQAYPENDAGTLVASPGADAQLVPKVIGFWNSRTAFDLTTCART